MIIFDLFYLLTRLLSTYERKHLKTSQVLTYFGHFIRLQQTDSRDKPDLNLFMGVWKFEYRVNLFVANIRVQYDMSKPATQGI